MSVTHINPYMTCPACSGSGLELNCYSGEPTHCRECDGDTVVRARDQRGRFAGNSTQLSYLDTTEALYPLGLQHLLAADLDEHLAEPLDSPEFDDIPEAQKQQMREAG